MLIDKFRIEMSFEKKVLVVLPDLDTGLAPGSAHGSGVGPGPQFPELFV